MVWGKLAREVSNVAELHTSLVGSRAAAGIEPGDLVAEKYRVERVLGAGGMGVVFMARHIHLDDVVALKVLSPDLLDSEQAVVRFRREAQAAAKLKNENVVRVFDVGVHRGSLPYLVMEYLEGGDLAQMIRGGGPLSVEQAADVLIQACSAVSAAHHLGIIHRDLKPSNLFCVPRADGGFKVKVVDFGISRVSEGPMDEQGITVTGHIVGSPSYMSPEQMRSSHRVDARSDIWSLGVVLYECLTGKLPFPATTYAEVCVKVTQDPPEPLVEREPPVPAALAAVVLRCLEKDRERRFATAAELALALVEFAPPSGRQLAESFALPGRRTTAELPAAASSAPPVTSALTSNRQSFTRTAHALRSHRLPWRAISLGFGAVLVLAAWFIVARRFDAPEQRNVNARDERAVTTSPPVVARPVEPAPRPTSAEPVASAPPAASKAGDGAAPDVHVAPMGTSEAAAAASAPHAPRPAQSAIAPVLAAGPSSHAPSSKALTERNPHSDTWQR